MKEMYQGEKIGEFLVRIEAMTRKQMEEIIKLKEITPDKLFGQIAIEKGYIDDKAIDDYLEAKFNISDLRWVFYKKHFFYLNFLHELH